MSNIKTYTSKEILEKIPSNWSEVKFKDFLNIINIQINPEDDNIIDSMENIIKISSYFLQLDEEIVKQFPMVIINDILNKISFIANKPEPLKESKYNWKKKIEEPDYDSFIVYLKVSEQLEKADYTNLPLILQKFCNDNLEIEEINNMGMDEIETGFFLLRASLMRYLKPIVISSTRKAIRQRTKEMMKEKIGYTKMKFKKTLRIIGKK